MTVVRETIEVKGEAPREVELRYTRHGPVLKVDRRRATAPSPCARSGTSPGSPAISARRACCAPRSWDEFKAASNAWGAPPLNLVYADVKGEIGWAASGRTPVRKNWDGLMPVPGDGRYEWDGFLAKDILPSVRNPAEGFFATANEYNLPKEYPAEERKIAFEWTDPSRATRIKEVLAADPKVSLADSMALQTDSVSPQSRRACRSSARRCRPATPISAARSPSCALGRQRNASIAPPPPSTRPGPPSISARRSSRG